MKKIKLKNGETIIKYKLIKGYSSDLDYYKGITEYGVEYGFTENDIDKEV